MSGWTYRAEYIFYGKNKRAFPKSCLLKSRWPYSMQSRFWVDKLKGIFQKSCFCSKVKMAIFYAEYIWNGQNTGES